MTKKKFQQLVDQFEKGVNKKTEQYVIFVANKEGPAGNPEEWPEEIEK
jgi:hypothetical protein